MFGNWLRGIDSDLKSLVLLVAAATCWSLWLCCRDNLSKQSYFLFTGYLHNFTCGFVHGLSSTHGLIAVVSQRLAQMANHSFFLPRGGDLVYGLTESLFLLFIGRLCAFLAEVENLFKHCCITSM